MPSQSIMLITSKPEKILLVCWSETADMKSIYCWKETGPVQLVGSKAVASIIFTLNVVVLYVCMYKSGYINVCTWTRIHIYCSPSTHVCVYLSPTSVRKRAALFLSKYASMNLHCCLSLAAFHSGRCVAEKQTLKSVIRKERLLWWERSCSVWSELTGWIITLSQDR